MSMTRMRDERGTSIVELVVVIALMGILLGIAGPSISAQINRAKINEAARDTVTVLRRVRSEAINEYQPRYVRICPDGVSPGASCKSSSLRIYAYRAGAWTTQSVQVIEFSGGVTVNVLASGDFPSLIDAPATGASVPAGAAYFSTRGGYPFNPANPTPGAYTITITGRSSHSRTIRFAPTTGTVTLQ